MDITQVTRSDFLAEPKRFIPSSSSIEVINEAGKPIMFIAGKGKQRPEWVRRARQRLAHLLEPLHPKINSPLDTSWIE